MSRWFFALRALCGCPGLQGGDKESLDGVHRHGGDGGVGGDCGILRLGSKLAWLCRETLAGAGNLLSIRYADISIST